MEKTEEDVVTNIETCSKDVSLKERVSAKVSAIKKLASARVQVANEFLKIYGRLILASATAIVSTIALVNNSQVAYGTTNATVAADAGFNAGIAGLSTSIAINAAGKEIKRLRNK